MHQTTVRFGADLWEALEDECMRLGVSVAQYLREAALTRLTYAAGKRGDDDFEDALLLSTGGGRETRRTESGRDSAQVVPAARTARDAQERAWREGSDAAALAAQGRLARRRARELRERAERSRGR